jgi:hypothetical protein
MSNNAGPVHNPWLSRARKIFFSTFLALVFIAISVALAHEGKDGKDDDDRDKIATVQAVPMRRALGRSATPIFRPPLAFPIHAT